MPRRRAGTVPEASGRHLLRSEISQSSNASKVIPRLMVVKRYKRMRGRMLSIDRMRGMYGEGDMGMSSASGHGWKRWFDLSVSASLLLFLVPFLLCVWVLVKMTSKGPGLYWSRRVGLGGDMFMMPKFRTMQVEAPSIPREALDATCGYLTPIGQFLRKLSIDELPQLWSVVVGDMSLVGPRPLLSNDPTTKIRRTLFPECFSVRPGITGLAQVNGRNSVKPKAKARYDAFYAVHCHAGMDFHILLRTAGAVLDLRRIL